MTRSNPYDKAHELASSIVAHDIYQNYLQAKNLVEAVPELKQQIMSLRGLQMEVNKAQVLGEEVSDDMIKEITLEFARLNQYPEAASFFQAESAFIRLFNDLQEIIQKTIENGYRG